MCMNSRRTQSPVTVVGLLCLCVIGLMWFARGVKHNDEIYKRLCAIEGVTGVERIDFEREYDSCIIEKYLVTFEQPVDWENPDLGTFEQRVEIGITDRADVNFMHLDGYAFQKDLLGKDYVPEPVEMYRGNYIHIEHRFYGASCPDDFSYDETKYWEYMTCENAVADYHNIYSKLEPLLGKTWVCFGEDQGGLMTAVYAGFFPDDCKLYMPFAAPCMESGNDGRFYDFIYTRIGDDALGKDKAGEYRDLIMKFQVNLIKDKHELLRSYNDEIDKTGMRFREYASQEVLYDLNVLEFAPAFWEYSQDFDKLEKLVDMPEETDEERQAKAGAEFKFMIEVQGPEKWSPDMYAWPYYVSAATETGQYSYDFSYLRSELAKAGVPRALTVTPGMEEELLWNVVFTENQKKAFTYSKSFHDKLISSLKSTDARILMIYGATDPWTSVRFTDLGNDNIKVYIHPTMSHDTTISSFPDDTAAEIKSVMDECING